jgi:transcriptional regulator GlxA family with amidase domain
MEPRVDRVIHLMTVDLKRDIPLDELARSVNLSVFRLLHLFKAETGTSPLQYLKTQRLTKARELLEITFLNLKEVLHRVGLKDRSHFAKDFKKQFGVPPLRYRNQYLLMKQQKSLNEIARTASR